MSPENSELKDHNVIQNLDLGNERGKTPWPLGRIEVEARNFFIATGELTYRSLCEQGMESLAKEILLYPGKITHLKRNLDIPPDGTQKRKTEALEIWESAHALSKRIGISRETFVGLTQKAAQEHPDWVGVNVHHGHPRTLYSPELLSLTLNQPQTFIDRKGRFKWALATKVNPELVQKYIEERVRTYIDAGVALTKPSLRTTMGNGTFPQMISLYYPGGYAALKENFGLNYRGIKDPLDIEPKKKSRRIWTLEQIELESRERINQFLDYIYKKEGVNPSRLKPFIVKVTKKHSILIVSDGRKPMEVFIPKKEPLSLDQRVLCQPKYDEVLGYNWLEGFTIDKGKRRQVFSKRFYQGDPNLYGWRGPEIQSLVDWIHELISIDKVKPVEISLSHRSKSVILEETPSSKIILQFHANPNLSQYDRLRLIPRQDEYAEWLEVQKVGKKGKYERVLTYRIARDRNNKLDSNWLGPERERLKKYREGRLPPDQLLPFTLPVKSEGRFYPLVVNGKSVELRLPPDRIPSSGKKITVVPSGNSEGDLVLTVYTDENQKDPIRFTLYKQTSKFIRSKEEESIISPEEANEQLRRLLEE